MAKTTDVKKTAVKKAVKKVTDRNTCKKTVKPRRMFAKKMELIITGTSKTAINKVAAKIHATSTDETTGGKEGRTVQITTFASSEPKQVFLGNV